MTWLERHMYDCSILFVQPRKMPQNAKEMRHLIMVSLHLHGEEDPKGCPFERRTLMATGPIHWVQYGPGCGIKPARRNNTGRVQERVTGFRIFFIFIFFKKKLQKYIFGFRFYKSIPLPPSRGRQGAYRPAGGR